MFIIADLFLLLIFALFIFWMITFVYTSFRGSPYVPIKSRRLHTITQFINSGDRVADLGCGDGRVMVEAAKRGASRVDGWELDFMVYLTALRRTLNFPHRSRLHFHFGDFWHADLTNFNVIYTYQMTKYMGPFQQKLLPQLKKGTLIISPDYEIPGLRLHQKITDKDRGIYIYKI